MSGLQNVHGLQRVQPPQVDEEMDQGHNWGSGETLGSLTAQHSSGTQQKIVCTERPKMMELQKFPGKKETFNVFEKIGKDWKNVGPFMLDEHVVDNLADCGTRNPYNISMAIVKRWLVTGGKRTTYGTLVSCLRDAQLPFLAKDIEEVVGVNSTKRPTLGDLMKFKGERETFNVIEKISASKFLDDVGMYLLEDYNKEKVTNIETTEGRSHDPVAITKDIISRWLKSSKEPPTWTALVRHLRSANLNTLADDIEEVLQSPDE